MGPTSNAISVFLGCGVLECHVEHESPDLVSREIHAGQITMKVGGRAASAAMAYHQAGGGPLITGLITGLDPAGKLVADMAVDEIPGLRRIATASGTSYSTIGAENASVVQPKIDELATLAFVKPWIIGNARIVVAPQMSELSPVMKRLVKAPPTQTILMLSRSQCEERKATLGFIKNCAMVHLDAINLALLTEKNDVVSGMNVLREQGVHDIIVLDDKRGITAFLDGKWHHQPAFRVDSATRPGLADESSMGCFLAARDQGQTNEESLRLAAAASGMAIANIKLRNRGLNELVAFATVTPTFPYAPAPHETLVDVIK
ncbi:MAG: hypothetical protein WCJ09_03655 [Planctomycetota bacterium]